MTRRIVVLAATFAFLIGGGRAEAQWEDIFGKFDRLSGPGPFDARVPVLASLRLACKREERLRYLWQSEFSLCWRPQDDQLQWYIAVQSTVAWSTERGLFTDEEEPLNEVDMIGIGQVALLVRYPEYFRKERWLEWGTAIGLSRFTAANADSFVRGTIDIPKLRVIPLGALDDRSQWYRVWQIDSGLQAFWPGANQDDFCPPGRCAVPPRAFETRFNLHPYFIMMFDFSEVILGR